MLRSWRFALLALLIGVALAAWSESGESVVDGVSRVNPGPRWVRDRLRAGPVGE